METFAAQMSALKEYRSKGEQKMTVQHVHVAEGGQAIVGNVNAAAEGGGAREKSGEQPHTSKLNMHLALRSHARSNRSGMRCSRPCGGLKYAGCMERAAALRGAIGTP